MRSSAPRQTDDRTAKAAMLLLPVVRGWWSFDLTYANKLARLSTWDRKAKESAMRIHTPGPVATEL
ncbi:MAG: hypothetical protein U0930_20420 [Pirellulales bacterium]